MSFIDKTYFYGELSIAQLSQPAVAASLQSILDFREQQLLSALMGYNLYNDFMAGIVVMPTPDALWKDIRDGKEYTYFGNKVKWPGLAFTIGTSKKSLIANYVYYWYIRDNHSWTTGGGEKKTEIAINVMPNLKLVRAWNEMVQWNNSLKMFLNYSGNYNTYSLDPFTDDLALHRSLLCNINKFNI